MNTSILVVLGGNATQGLAYILLEGKRNKNSQQELSTIYVAKTPLLHARGTIN